jgi:hypothetical protein
MGSNHLTRHDGRANVRSSIAALLQNGLQFFHPSIYQKNILELLDRSRQAPHCSNALEAAATTAPLTALQVQDWQSRACESVWPKAVYEFNALCDD